MRCSERRRAIAFAATRLVAAVAELGSFGVSILLVKWSLVILNVAAHRTHAYSVCRELQEQRVLVERPDYDVQRRLRTIAAGGSYSSTIA